MTIDREQQYWGLWATHIRDRYEDIRLLAIAKSKEELHKWVDSMRVDPYEEIECYYGDRKTLRKSFKKDSPLEWFNLFPLEGRDAFGTGIASIGSVNQFIMTQEEKFKDTINSYLIEIPNDNI